MPEDEFKEAFGYNYQYAQTSTKVTFRLIIDNQLQLLLTMHKM